MLVGERGGGIAAKGAFLEGDRGHRPNLPKEN
jgi:hypothetical protein